VPAPGDTAGPVAGYIAGWRPSSVSSQAAAFARAVITETGPAGQERAKNLLWAAGKLADYGIGLGLDAVPEVLLHPSVTERFTRCAPALSGVARRTLRTNLRFIGRRVVPQLWCLATSRCVCHCLMSLSLELSLASRPLQAITYA
jgi:hypothetical protein